MNLVSCFKALCAGLLLAVAGTTAAAEPTLAPMSQSYDVTWSSTPLGVGSLTLTATGDDCYHYEMRTRPIGLVRWLYGSPKEDSDFCIREGVVVPSHMSFTNDQRKKDSFSLDFDWAHKQVLGGRNGPLAIPLGALDRLSVQQAARLWVKTHLNDPQPGTFVTSIADHKRVKAYTFAIRGRGTVETAAGRFDAIRFERIDSPNTTLRFWLAPEKDYMPVKVENIEDGEAKLSLSLQNGG